MHYFFFHNSIIFIKAPYQIVENKIFVATISCLIMSVKKYVGKLKNSLKHISYKVVRQYDTKAAFWLCFITHTHCNENNKKEAWLTSTFWYRI